MRRLALLVLVPTLGVLGFSFAQGGSEDAVFHADFRRAVQVFPGVHVRVLGVDVGIVSEVKNVAGAARVTFRLERHDIKIPADVSAAVVPSSLLGERYIQLFPAYQGGPQLAGGSVIPIERTAVPAEPDELLRSLQDYLGALDPDTVAEFVQNAAAILEDNGAELNRLIEHGSNVMETLAGKRQDLTAIIVELNEITQALSTRQAALGSLIDTYGVVTGNLNENRAALEGTIQGLNLAATELADLLSDHQEPLKDDIEVLTRTSRTLTRNIEALARTAGWARSLFDGASRAVDYDEDWLRLGNQGQELSELILLRLEERLIEICEQAGDLACADPSFWEQEVPDLFCQIQCPPPLPGPLAGAGAQAQLTKAIQSQPGLNAQFESAATAKGTDVDGVVDSLLEGSVGNPVGVGGAL